MAQKPPPPPATHKTNRHCMRNSWCRRRPLCVAAHSHYPLEAARGNSHCGACGILACSPAAPLPPISKICSSEQVMPLAEDSVENTSTLPLLEKFVNVSVKARGGTIGCTDFLNNRLPPLPVISQARHVAAAVGVAGSLVSPAVGVIACIEAYLLNPTAIQMENYGIRFQLIATIAFLVGFLIHRPRGIQKVGREGGLAVALWVFVAIGALSSLWAVVSSANALHDIYEMFKTVLLATMLIRAITNERQMRWVIIACILGVWHAAALHVFGVRLGLISSFLGREEGVLPDYQTGVMVLFVPLLVLLAILGSKTERILSWIAQIG